ncbi:MAG: di-heme oxidoredictase family protein [Coraliomargaritaceae bacterium]
MIFRFVICYLLSLVLCSGENLSYERGYTISWPTVSDREYQLQKESNGEWMDVGEVILGDGSQRSQYFPTANSANYRVQETSTPPPQISDLLLNGGFETGNATGFEHWQTNGSRLATRYDGDAKSGTYCARGYIEVGGASARECRLFQRIDSASATIQAGSSYDFSFWAKQIRSGPSYIQEYQLLWLGSSGQYLGGTGVRAFNPTLGTWTEIREENLIAPAGTASAEVVFRMVTGAVANGHGEVLIDDVLVSGSNASNTPAENSIQFLYPESTTSDQISWLSRDNIAYQPQTSVDLSEWVDIGSERIGDGDWIEVIVPRDGEARFFRIQYVDDTSEPVSLGEIIPLYSSETVLNSPVQIETDDALITRLGDRARDRHARESQFQAYDHYLSWYWEERTIDIEIIDRVAKGGTTVTFNYETKTPLSQPEFRAFYRGIGTVAEYHFNVLADLVATNQYRATVVEKLPEYRPLQIGDRMEIEISQFIASPMNGRNNYYGTTFLYIVGQGVVPWEGKGPRLDSYPLPEIAWLGGETTLPYHYSNEPDNRFKQTAGNISPDTIEDFMLGRRLHHTNFQNGSHSEPGNPVFTQQMGKIGPRFITRSCVECHVNNGRSLPPATGQNLEQAVVHVGSDAKGTPHGSYGSVLQPNSLQGSAEPSIRIESYETITGQYGDGTSYTLRKPVYSFNPNYNAPDYYTVRMAQQLIGLGLLEAIDEGTILAQADPEDEDGDGISGKARLVTDPETGEIRLGRFTHKAGQATIEHQIASAMNGDMGIATHLFPILDGDTTNSSAELSSTELEQMTKYVALLGVGARRNLDDNAALQGEALFTSIGCVDCHTPEQTTGSHHPLAELRNQTIRSFTDLLLHDMGPSLADNMGEGNALGSEWRTPPLWNIGLTSGVSGGEAYLHDGRARSLEEAILWHGGEGEASMNAFKNLSSSQRDALIAFLRTL